MTLNQIVTWIVTGAVTGFIADSVIRGIKVGLLGAVVLGIIGGLFGGWLFWRLNIIFVAGMLGDILMSFIGAAALLAILRYLKKI